MSGSINTVQMCCIDMKTHKNNKKFDFSLDTRFKKKYHSRLHLLYVVLYSVSNVRNRFSTKL